MECPFNLLHKSIVQDKDIMKILDTILTRQQDSSGYNRL